MMETINNNQMSEQIEVNKIYTGDCLEEIKKLPDSSVDAIVTDAPYELGFMGKEWDNTGIANNVDMWKECLRVLKPGGHLLSFGGTRTYHRMASAIEDAGFEIRDMIEWVYGSGFPKSLNIGKAVDKLAERGENHKIMDFVIEEAEKQGKTKSDLSKLFLSKNGKPTGWLWNKASHNQTLTDEQFSVLKDYLNLPFESLYEMEKKVIGRGKAGLTKGTIANFAGETEFDIAALVTEEAKKWEGWGTALKPAHEPICMARKPLAEKTVAENCLKWGTGGINIDESRVEANEELGRNNNARIGGTSYIVQKETMRIDNSGGKRFPANLIHDNSEEVRECFPENKSSNAVRRNKVKTGLNGIYNEYEAQDSFGFNDSGNASRFFKSIIYQAKASKSERNKGCEGLEEKQSVGGGGGIGDYLDDVNSASGKYGSEKAPAKNNHPTVKPIALMEYLINMVTREGQTVLDPFAGSGTTLIAAKKLGRKYIGIELEPEYVKIAEERLRNTTPPLFKEEIK